MDASCSSASNCGIITYYKFNKMKEKVTLVVVDFQYDFCLLGAPLYVPGSDKALWNISHLIENNKVGRVIFTADWHPSNHCSFKKNGGQWNEHCVQFSKGAAIHDLLLYGCIGAGIPYEVITKGTLSLSEEYGIKVAPANAKVQYHTIYSSSVGVDVQPDEQVVICGLAGDFCVLETLKNLAPVNPMIFLDGVAPIGITVYHMLKSPRYLANESIRTVGGFTSDTERDEAMTRDSDYDIAFIRKGKETSGTAQNILRRWTK